MASIGSVQAQHQHGTKPEPTPPPEHSQHEEAQVAPQHAEHGMEHQMSAMLGPYAAMRESSGTSWIPDTSPMLGRHFAHEPWTLMLHGMATLAYTDQGGRRGDEDLFGTNMLMLMASRPLASGRLGVRAMLSLEPATVGDDGYPLLFQTGETGDGTTPLVDAQHAHDLFMELAATYSMPLGADRSLFAYLGLPGEPALGPPTFMHRPSGVDDPEAPLGHHWLDSTHISFGVATLGAVWGPVKLDASLFNGREPDEERWNFESGALDSEAVRLSYNPSSNWAFQVSYGELHEPEQLEPDVDVARTTVSAIYHRAWGDDFWSTTFAAGRNDKDPGSSTEALLLESALTLAQRDTWFARVEHVEKDELFDGGHPLAGSTFDVDKFSLGYLRELAEIEGVQVAAGAVGSVYAFDDALEPYYGDHPRSFVLFLRARL